MVDVAHGGVGHALVFHAVARREFTEVSLVVPWGMFDFVGGSAQLSVALVQFQVFFGFVVHKVWCTALRNPNLLSMVEVRNFFALCNRIAQAQDLLRCGHWVQQFATMRRRMC